MQITNELQSAFLRRTDYESLVFSELRDKDVFGVMDSGIDVLNSFDMEWQLGAGTLLGFIREEKGFIDHDSDIDIEVYYKDFDIDKFHREFSRKGFLMCREQYYKNLPVQLVFLDTRNIIVFDIAFYHHAIDDIYFTVNEHGVILRPSWTRPTLHIGGKGNGTYNVPNKYEKYLEVRYGKNWKTPYKYKDSWENDAGDMLILL